VREEVPVARRDAQGVQGLVLVGSMTSSHSMPPYLVRQAEMEAK
jgi:hypothetical protein